MARYLKWELEIILKRMWLDISAVHMKIHINFFTQKKSEILWDSAERKGPSYGLFSLRGYTKSGSRNLEQ